MDLQERAAENRSNAPGVERSRRDGTVRGHWLILARGMCIALFGFSLTVFFADLPGYFAQLHTICASAICPLWQLTPTSTQALQQVGLSVESYTIFSIALSIISVFVWSTVGAVIAWRKSNDWMALLVAILLVTTGILYIMGRRTRGSDTIRRKLRREQTEVNLTLPLSAKLVS